MLDSDAGFKIDRSPIINSEWLDELLDDDRFKLKLLVVGKSGQRKEIEGVINNHLPSASFVDISGDFSEISGRYPNTFPSTATYRGSCSRLGIDDETVVVILDIADIYLSPRLWYIFYQMGHQHVYVLNGGLSEWSSYKRVKDGRSRDSENHQLASVRARSGDMRKHFLTIDEIRSNINNEENLLIDVRSADRYHSRIPEPRSGLRSGHIPKSVNIPFSEFLTDGKYKSGEDLREVFANVIGPDTRPLIFSCGSGVTACIGLLAGFIVLENMVLLYDGSWTEWGSEE